MERLSLDEPVTAVGRTPVPHQVEGIIGADPQMREVFQKITDAASVEIAVLITGETGTGKDLVAAAIHKRSRRTHRPYVPVNMGAIAPELIMSELFGHEKGAYTGAIERRQGFFEQAAGGSIFLDEISTMDDKTQVALLRVVENKSVRRVRGDKDLHVDVRVIAASNESLHKAIANHRFREDLYYRLDVFRIHVPPLRDRPGDITLLTESFAALFNETYQKNLKTIPPETYQALQKYRWPGNVRELKNVVQRAVVLSKGQEFIPDLLPERLMQAVAEPNGVSRLPQSDPCSIRAGMTLDAAEKEFILMTLAATSGNKKLAATQLGISRRSLYNKIEKYSLACTSCRRDHR